MPPMFFSARTTVVSSDAGSLASCFILTKTLPNSLIKEKEILDKEHLSRHVIIQDLIKL